MFIWFLFIGLFTGLGCFGVHWLFLVEVILAFEPQFLWGLFVCAGSRRFRRGFLFR